MPRRVARRALLGGLTAACFAPSAIQAAERAGAVETSRGDCYALAAAQRRALAPAAEIFIGDAVGTGVQSALGLRLGSATQVKLGAEARLRIDRFLVNSGGVLVLDNGAMLYDHAPGNSAAEVAVRTPFGLVAVRGTRFFAGPSNGPFGVFVERGTVVVVGASTFVTVTDGMGTDVPAPGGEPTPPHPWGPARIAAAMASVN
jgi:FecR protein